MIISLRTVTFGLVLLFCVVSACNKQEKARQIAVQKVMDGDFEGSTGSPVLCADKEWISVKDPSIVKFENQFHLFCTVRGRQRSHSIIYLAFASWDQITDAPRTVLTCHDGYFCAPQIFYFSPHKKWYLVCQASDEKWDLEYQPAFSTSDDLSDPAKWSPLQPMVGRKFADVKAWLDFWIICDQTTAYLFFTSLDGKMWRSQTSLDDFPHNWSDADVVLEDDIFEAGHIYKLKGATERYLALIEAQHGYGWRYYKAYTAGRLDGDWLPLAATKEKNFACMKNVLQEQGHWTDSISHGELVRAGYDEHLEVDPADLEFVFQGVLDSDREGKTYGEIPWCLGLLEID
ncbi:hypothetical protein JW935_16510 [candidate division KSB1 bacterium]|nr:hypothetical protein [candidate division KSB1 bacterium]